MDFSLFLADKHLPLYAMHDQCTMHWNVTHRPTFLPPKGCKLHKFELLKRGSFCLRRFACRVFATKQPP